MLTTIETEHRVVHSEFSAALTLATLALAACATYTPDPLEPSEELRRLVLRTEQDLHVVQRGPWQASWFPLTADVDLADGLTIGEANALALFYSPAVLEARAAARVAGAQVLQSGLLANPELFLGPRISAKGNGVTFPAWLAWELPLWGKLDAERDTADARFTASRLAAIDVELATLRAVRESFLRLRRLQREQQVLAAVAESSQKIVGWVEGLRAAGVVDAVALYLARAERDQARAALERVRLDATVARRELLARVGLLPDASVTPVVDAADAALPALPQTEDEALLRLPSLRAAEASYAATEAALRLEISKQYPNIKLGPEFEQNLGDPSIGLGLAFTLPLFDRNQGGIAAAEESRWRARQRYRAELLQAAHAEAAARDALGSAERLLAIYRNGAVADADEAGRALEIRLRAGRVEVVEVLAAQRAIARTRSRVLELEEQAAVARLRAAVAGGLALQKPPAETEQGEEIEK